jgi:hypothetical protein
MKKHAWILVGLSLVAFVALVGCATAVPTSTPQPSSTPTPTAAPTSTPAPTATPAATQPSISTSPVTLTVEELTGFWDGDAGCIEFKPDGTWLAGYSPSFIQAGRYDHEGKFSVEGDLLTLSDTPGCDLDIGVYRLKSKAEGQLTLGRVKDDCWNGFTEWSRWPTFASELRRVP